MGWPSDASSLETNRFVADYRYGTMQKRARELRERKRIPERRDAFVSSIPELTFQ